MMKLCYMKQLKGGKSYLGLQFERIQPVVTEPVAVWGNWAPCIYVQEAMNTQEVGMSTMTSRPTPRDQLPPKRICLLNSPQLSKQHLQTHEPIHGRHFTFILYIKLIHSAGKNAAYLSFECSWPQPHKLSSAILHRCHTLQGTVGWACGDEKIVVGMAISCLWYTASIDCSEPSMSGLW